MITKAHRFRSIGWLALLAVCIALVMVLAFRVNALRSQVKRTEDKIIALRQEQSYLQLEFETRASQQQLRDWNVLEFGYAAPTAGQYLENERQLAQFARPDAPGAPVPIRVASLDDTVAANAAFPAFVSPLSGKPLADEAAAGSVDQDEGDGESKAATLDHGAAKAALGAKLARVPALHGDETAAEPAVRKVQAKPARASAVTAKPKVLAEAKSATTKTARAAPEARGRK